MKNLKTFSEFISEATEFNPANTSDIDVLLPAIKSATELKPGKEYVVKLNGKIHSNMLYQGVSDGNYIFNSEDMETVLNLNREQINGAVSDGGVQQVNEAVRRTADQVNKDSENKGLTIVPLRLFTNEKGLAKLEIALCRGKKNYDKRESLKEQDTKRDLDRIKKAF